MYRRNNRSLYKLLAERYFEEDICCCDVKNFTGYKITARQIIAAEDRILDKYPDAMDDLNALVDLYGKLSKAKSPYLFEDGVFFALGMILPEMMSMEFARVHKWVMEGLERPMDNSIDGEGLIDACDNSHAQKNI